MDSVAEKIGNIVADKKELLNGFKVLGAIPFYLNYIKVSTNIDLMILKEKLKRISGDKVPTMDDFHNPVLLKKIKPIIEEYITIALVNKRFLGFIFKPFVKYKIRQCGHRHIHNMYLKILELSDPAFFLDYWTHMTKQTHVLLKMENQSSEQLELIKKSLAVVKKK